MTLFLLIFAAVLAVAVIVITVGADDLVGVAGARILGLLAMVSVVAAAAIHVTENLA